MSMLGRLGMVAALTAGIGGMGGGSGRGYKPPRRKVPKSVQEEKKRLAELKNQRKAAKRAPASTKYAINSGTQDAEFLYWSLVRFAKDPLSRAWMSGTQDAFLFSSWESAYEELQTNFPDDCGIAIEFVTDVEEFRARAVA